MTEKLLVLRPDGKPAFKLPDGSFQPISGPRDAAVFLLLDCSGSMGAGGKLENACAGSASFAGEAIAKGYAVGIVNFDDQAYLALEPTRDLASITEALSRCVSEGTTNLTAALQLAATKLNEWKGQRVIVIATDGKPNSTSTALSAANEAKRVGITILAQGTDDADEAFLKSIASAKDLAAVVSRKELGSSIARAARLLPPTRQG